MHIPLTDDKGRRGRQKARGRRSNRRPRTFETATTLPQVAARSSRRARSEQGAGDKPDRASRAARRSKTALEARPARMAGGTLLWRGAASLLLLALVGGMGFGSLDARFFVYEGRIVGAEHLGAEAIYQAAGVHEQNIFWIDPARVAQRIVALDGIKAARVRCDLPATVAIEVEERQPVVLWRVLAQEHDWWLDEEGVVLPYHGDAQAARTLFVVDSSPHPLQVGQRVEPEGIVQSVRQLAAALPDIRIFFYEPDRGLSFTQGAEGADWPVYVGSSDDLAQKIQVMQTLTGYFKANGIRPRYVDVRWAAHPVYGRAAGETVGGGE